MKAIIYKPKKSKPEPNYEGAIYLILAASVLCYGFWLCLEALIELKPF